MFFKTGVLKAFAILTRKHLRWSLFFLVKLHALGLVTFFKKDSKIAVFP